MHDMNELTNDQLSEAVATHVAGWAYHPVHKLWHDNFDRFQPKPTFSTSADAVLPLLAAFKYNFIERTNCQNWKVIINNQDGEWCGWDNVFPRAACIALLRAAGFKP